MSSPSTTARGRAAEALVAAFLEARGWVILQRNARLGRDEIDLLALDGATLVCVEVRARRPGAMVDALSSITPAKQRRMRRAALRCAVSRQTQEIRIDVATVTDGAVELLENAVDFSAT
jgi:putative endonuclease